MADDRTAAATPCCSCFSFVWRRSRVLRDGTLNEPLFYTAAEDNDEQGLDASAASHAGGGLAAAMEDDAGMEPSIPSDPDGLSVEARGSLNRVLQEVLQTERTYVSALSSLISHFLPLLKPHLENAGDADSLLVTAGALHGVHRELLERLELAGTDMWGVSRAFASLTPFLRVYGTYCGGYEKTLARVTELRRTLPALGELESARGELLDSLLIKPVQRLCKYPLFFGEMLKLLPAGPGLGRGPGRPGGGESAGCAEGAPLRAELESCCSAIRAVSDQVNAMTRDAAEAARLVELYHELGGSLPELLAPTRTLLHEADLRLADMSRRRRVGSSRRRACHVALLTDAVIIARIRQRALTSRALSSAFNLGRRGASERHSFGSDAGASAAGGGGGAKAPPLKLIAVLPLRHVQMAPDALPRARAAAAAAAGSSTSSSVLQLQCRSPTVSYTCKCSDADAAAALLEAVNGARRKLDAALRSSERRASLVPGGAAAVAAAAVEAHEAEGCDTATDTLVSSARGSRRRSLTDRLGLGTRTGRHPKPADAVEEGTAAREGQEDAAPSSSSSSSSCVASSAGRRAGQAVAEDAAALPMVGLLCSSDEDSCESSGTESERDSGRDSERDEE